MPYLVGRDFREVTAFGKELTQEPVGVFAGSSFPRAVRVTEVNLDGGLSGDPAMGCELRSLVGGERFAQRGWDTAQASCEGLADGSGVASRDRDKDGKAGRSFDEGTHGSVAAASAQEQIAFPVAWDGAVIRFRWAVVDEQGLDELTAPVAGSASSAMGTALS